MIQRCLSTLVPRPECSQKCQTSTTSYAEVSIHLFRHPGCSIGWTSSWFDSSIDDLAMVNKPLLTLLTWLPSFREWNNGQGGHCQESSSWQRGTSRTCVPWRAPSTLLLWRIPTESLHFRVSLDLSSEHVCLYSQNKIQRRFPLLKEYAQIK